MTDRLTKAALKDVAFLFTSLVIFLLIGTGVNLANKFANSANKTEIWLIYM